MRSTNATRRASGSLFALVLSLILFAETDMTASATGSPRVVQSLDENWRFHLGEVPDAIRPSFDESNWRRVDVPHDYVVGGTFAETTPFLRANEGRAPNWYFKQGSLPVQPAVYRKALDIPATARGKRLWLEFDGVGSNSRYWLNGHEVGDQYSGYNRSRFDITTAANPGGDNLLTVQVDPRYDGWWYEGAGIYRHVRLVTVDPVHIAPDGVFVAPAVENPGDGENADALVTAETDVSNTSARSVNAKVLREVLGAEGGYVEWLAAQGVTAYVLQYRLGSAGYRHPVMLHDAARALRTVRALARAEGLDSARVGIIGSSAGGHLASTLLTHFDAGLPDATDPIERESSRPDLGILCYPVITMGEFTHGGSKFNLLGENPPPALVRSLSNETQVTAATPPCFVWHTVEDDAVPVENSLQFAAALRRAGVPFELHLYEKGGHGMGLGWPGGPAESWPEVCLAWLKGRRFLDAAAPSEPAKH